MISSKKNRIISILLVLTLIFQFAGCTGVTGKLSGEPSEVLEKLQTSVRKLNTADILSLTVAEKGSSIYREYEDYLNIDAYEDDIAGCYRTVAESITFKYEESDIDIGNRIAKVHLTVVMPEWKKVFSDISLADADTVIEQLKKASTEELHVTLRIIETKDGLRIKNTEDLMDILEFVGWDIASAPTWNSKQPGESRPAESKPSETEPSEPSETEPSETKPGESEPSAKEPTNAPKPGSKDTLSAAYAAYKNILTKNKETIEWYEKNINANSCGLLDINNDSIPELYFFGRNAKDDKFINLFVYTYDPERKTAKSALSATLIEYASKVSEFFVFRDGSGNIVLYKGFIDEKNVISYYNTYEYSNFANMLVYSGYLISGVVDGNKENAVCTVKGFGGHYSNESIKYDEFLRIEKELLEKTDVVLGAKLLPSSRSSAADQMKSKKIFGQDYNAVLKQLG